MKLHPFRWTLGLVVGLTSVGCLSLIGAGCDSSDNGAPMVGGSTTPADAAVYPLCTKPAPGCSCSTAGAFAACTQYEQRSGSYVSCLSGTMICENGAWGSCGQKSSADKLTLSANGIQVDNYVAPTFCGAPDGGDPCDPSGDASDEAGVVPGCNQTVDTPGGFDAGSHFALTDAGGLTPAPVVTSEAGIVCTGLAVNPPVLNATVTSFSPLTTSPVTTTFNAAYTPAACYMGLANASWSVDQRGLAAISNGVVTLVSGVAGPINVSAYSAGFQASARLNVTTNVVDASQVTPAVASKFTGNGTAPDTLTFLYPYANTVFPRSVAAPVVQWNETTAGTAVKITLQYPATGTPIFTASQILPESTPPQAALSQVAWGYLDQTAAGNDALISVQRLVGGVLLNPVSETIHFANSALRGNIFYTEYDVTAWTAAVKSAKPFGTTPAEVTDPTAGCNPCHSVSANGTTMVSSNWGNTNTSIMRVNGDGTLTPVSSIGNQPSPTAQDSRGFAYSAISPDGTLALQGSNWWGNTVEPSSTVTQASAPHGNGAGLTGTYYANTTQTGSPALTETDPDVDFTWGAATPGGGIAAGSNYSVVWTGFVQSIYSQTYTFETESSDGVKLTVNGQVLVNHLNAQTDTKYSGTIAMTAGSKVPITLVYENVSNTSQVHLRWSSPSQPYQVINETQLYPSAVALTTGLNGSYYANVTSPTTFNFATATPTATRLDSTVNFPWNGAAPIGGVGNNQWAAEWDGSVKIPCTGTYQFCVTGDDGVRLSVDGALVANGWVDQGATTYCGATSTLTAGSQHVIKMQYYQDGGGSEAQLSWNSSCAANGIIPTADLIPAVIPPPATNGLTGTYYANIDFSGAATTEVDSTVNFNWNGSSPALNVGGNNWSAEWTGQVSIPCTGNYQFCVTGDDGVRLWVDGTKIDDGWFYQGATLYCNSVSGGNLAETAGTKHDIKMDYFQGGGGSVAELQWQSSCISGGVQIIPNANLFPSGDQGTGGYDVAFHSAGDLGTGTGYSIFQLPSAVGGTPIDQTGANSWGLGKTAMMVPTFSPDGSKLVFVDGDTSGGASWRQGLSFFSFNQGAQAFSTRTNFVNMVSAGNVIRWPAVESDSQSVIFQTNPTSQDDANSYAQYGGMLPSGYSSIPGQLWSVNMNNPSPVSLAKLNQGLGGIDTNLSYQPTVLPAAAGGYRWTIFTSDRQYGNTQNVPGSGLTGTDQLWVGAIDDTVSGAADRSHPPFWFPNQVLGDNGGRIRNERAYWVLDACRGALPNLNPPASATPQTFNWVDQDIGTAGDPAHAGSASASGGVISITAGGDDIWGTSDAFHYAYVPVSGDFQFIARVKTVGYSDYWAKAGVMLRDNLGSNAAFAFILMNAGQAASYQWRTTGGGGAGMASGPGEAFPYWVRLTRTGAVVNGDVSPDGVNWTNVGTLTPTIGTNAYIGLAVTAHNNSTTTTATFDNAGFVATAAADNRPASLCQDDQDCCGAQTTPPTAACQVDVPIPTPVTRHCILLSGNSCVALGSTCISDSDCCGFPTNKCNTQGVCVVPPPPYPYADTVLTRDYVASCPMGEQPVWRFLNWASITPGDSDIAFAAATAAMASLLPATIGNSAVVPIGKATGATSFLPGPVTPVGGSALMPVGSYLSAAGQSPNLNYLRLFADFQPSSDGSQVPTLNAWELQYDCAAAE
jgi:hypothetical protein